MRPELFEIEALRKMHACTVREAVSKNICEQCTIKKISDDLTEGFLIHDLKESMDDKSLGSFFSLFQRR